MRENNGKEKKNPKSGVNTPIPSFLISTTPHHSRHHDPFLCMVQDYSDGDDDAKQSQ